MRLTTRGKLAVTALTDLALHSHGQPVPLPSIGARQGISLSYLEDIFSALRRAGLVRSTRGPGGGYRLARDSSKIFVAEIITAAQAPLAAPAPVRRSPDGADMTAELWSSFHWRVMEYLQSISLCDLLAQQQRASAVVASPPGAAAGLQPRAKPSRPPSQLPAQHVPNSVFALGALPRAVPG